MCFKKINDKKLYIVENRKKSSNKWVFLLVLVDVSLDRVVDYKIVEHETEQDVYIF